MTREIIYAAAIVLLLIVGCIGWGIKLAEVLSCTCGISR